ncbi:hypothetical protein [Mesorhizobium sp. L-8-10]|nr:hypothetical protein [Mesorhizobium sp. L-8-10]
MAKNPDYLLQDKSEGLPERIGHLLGMIVFIGVCCMVAWPIVQSLFF